MADTITFTYYFGEDNKLEITASVGPYDPGRSHGPPEDCYPPEGGEVEITLCELVAPNGTGVPFDPEGICIRRRSSDGVVTYANLTDDIETTAFEKIREELG